MNKEVGEFFQFMGFVWKLTVTFNIDASWCPFHTVKGTDAWRSEDLRYPQNASKVKPMGIEFHQSPSNRIYECISLQTK